MWRRYSSEKRKRRWCEAVRLNSRIVFQLILAKYGASKLEIIKQITLDAALDDFECRSRLECRFKQTPVDRFIEFASNAYRKAAKSVSDFIRAPDWTIFDENGNANDHFLGRANVEPHTGV